MNVKIDLNSDRMSCTPAPAFPHTWEASDVYVRRRKVLRSETAQRDASGEFSFAPSTFDLDWMVEGGAGAEFELPTPHVLLYQQELARKTISQAVIEGRERRSWLRHLVFPGHRSLGFAPSTEQMRQE